MQLRRFFLAAVCAASLFAQENAPVVKKPAEQVAPAVPKAPPESVNPGPVSKQAETATNPKVAPLEFSVDAMDRTANPCENFYQFACGNWRKQNPIPPDQSTWNRFSQLAEHNRDILRGILEQSAANPSGSELDQKIGDFYGSCMDEAAINKKGLEPLKPMLDRIDALPDKQAIAGEIVQLQKRGVGVLFSFYSGPDAKNSTMMIAQVDQGGLSLPDRDYYLKDDEKSVALRKQYLTHVQNMLQLMGGTAEKAPTDAAAILKIETELARGSMPLVDRRDPTLTYHKMTERELYSLSPWIEWNKYFEQMGTPAIQSLNVVAPNFFRQLETTIVANSLADLKTYLKWHLVSAEAGLLPDSFVNENFNFFGKILTGAEEITARWKRCVDMTDGDLGEALGRKYVDLTFGAEGKERTLKMVHEIEHALDQDMATLSWMTPPTKQQALVKLKAVANKIGYPDKWRDYSSVTIARGDAIGNDMRATEFEVNRQLAKIGKPVDRKEWGMTPPTVNAYYNPSENNINFPAGILQPPFYDNRMDDAVNYGAIGSVVGHELTHGFDDQGRQYDAEGNVRDWWTPADAKAFEERADCFVKEYGSFTPVAGVHLNGKLTLGENTADNGGIRLAFMALMDELNGKQVAPINGFTPEQRFFLGWGQIWCQNIREEASRMRAQVDPHSPGGDRVNGTVSNMPEFQKAYSCKVGDAMVRHPACRVW